ncbi:MAG TPA: hypothetical protein VJL88_11700 [Nitrospira sp.]|nr:hypothetical protein [Nitrospira sp.]
MPFFQPTAEDTAQLATLASDLDSLAMECGEESTCEDQVHFARAFVSLFENREAARVSFEQVISLHPSSLLAASSALWLQVLQKEGLTVSSKDPQQRLLIDTTAQSIREWLSRQGITGRTSQPRTVPKAATVQTLYKQVQDRDRRIAELRSQLDALKLIDQDQQDRQRKMRTPPDLRKPLISEQ